VGKRGSSLQSPVERHNFIFASPKKVHCALFWGIH
jgi:hypothetical protein